jgi:hypothetical protein
VFWDYNEEHAMTTTQSDKSLPEEPDQRNLKQAPKQTSEVPLGSGSQPEPAGSGGFGSHSSESSAEVSRDSTLPSTSRTSDKPGK